ncbi:beta-ketoacyl synthase N-terminal-like domain-containing protein [Bacillus cytotoxicus]
MESGKIEGTMKQSHSLNDHDIAIIGMSGVFPGANDIPTFWENLLQGKDCITRKEPLNPSGTFVHAYGAVENIEQFDAEFFSISEKEASQMDPQHRVLLQCAYHALEDAGYVAEEENEIGAFFGTDEPYYVWENLFQQENIDFEKYAEKRVYMESSLSGKVSYKLNLKGPSLVVRTACSTSLVAVHLACQSLLTGECNMALAGAVSIFPNQTGYAPLEGAMSRSGYTKTFDQNGDGFVPGNGAGLIVIKRLKDAVSAGDHIYAVIKGSAINNDGNQKVGYTAPSAVGQATVIQKALEVANVKPSNISYIETHGTATPLGDAVELRALYRVFQGAQDGRVKIGSVKPNIGHLNQAAGIAGLIKVALSLYHKKIPASIHFNRENPQLKIEKSPFQVVTECVNLKECNTPLLAGVSSFGIGGTNAHIVLGEPPTVVKKEEKRDNLILYNAKTLHSLQAKREQLIEFFTEERKHHLEDIAYTLQKGREYFQYREFIVADSYPEAVKALEKKNNDMDNSSNIVSQNPHIIFVFPGAGEKDIKNIMGLYGCNSVFCKALNECLDEIDVTSRRNIREIYLNRDTCMYEKPALYMLLQFAVSYALGKMWMSMGIKPFAMIGHSFGEYAAACLAGVISLKDAMFLTKMRGNLFESMEEGRMISVLIEGELLLRNLPKGISVAAINGVNRYVLAGHVNEIERFIPWLQKEGIAYVELPVNKAGHSPLVEPFIMKFKEYLNEVSFSTSDIPIISTLTGDWLKQREIEKPEYWLRQMRETVRFSEAIQVALAEEKVVFLEIGAGQQLTYLIKKMLVNSQKQAVYPTFYKKTNDDWRSILRTIGELWVRGIEISWDALYKKKPHRVSVPGYPFQKQFFSVKQDFLKKTIPSNKERFSLYTYYWKQSYLIDEPEIEKEELWIILGNKKQDDDIEKEIKKKFSNIKVCKIYQKSSYKNVGNNLFYMKKDKKSDFENILQDCNADNFYKIRIIDFWNCRNTWRHICSGTSAKQLIDKLKIYTFSNEIESISGLSTRLKNLTIDDLKMEISHKIIHEANSINNIMNEINDNWDERYVLYRHGERWVSVVQKFPLGNKSALGEKSSTNSYVCYPSYQNQSARKGEKSYDKEIRKRNAFNLDYLKEVEKKTRALYSVQPLNHVPGLLDALEKLCLSCIVLFVREKFSGLEHVSLEEWGKNQEKNELYSFYMDFFSKLLQENRLLSIEKGEIFFSEEYMSYPEPKDLYKKISHQFPLYSTLMELIVDCTSYYHDVFSGKFPANAVLFPNGDFHKLISYYNKLPEFSWKSAYIHVLIEYILSLFNEKRKKTFRILEIGAGIGSLSWSLLEKLQGVQHVEYYFTDISPVLLHRAKRKAEKLGMTNIKFMRFDITKSGEVQGFEKEYFDAIVGINVIQISSCLQNTMGYLADLLKENGKLCIIQTILVYTFHYLIFGLSPGWWNFKKDVLREHTPLLSQEQWRDLLGKQGFEPIQILPTSEENLHSDVTLFIAEKRKNRSDEQKINTNMKREQSNHKLMERNDENKTLIVSLEQLYDFTVEKEEMLELKIKDITTKMCRWEEDFEIMQANVVVLIFKTSKNGYDRFYIECFKNWIARKNKEENIRYSIVIWNIDDENTVLKKEDELVSTILSLVPRIPVLYVENKQENYLCSMKQLETSIPHMNSGPSLLNDRIEMILHEIIRDVLGVYVHDPKVSFFELGMDSLSGLMICARVQKQLDFILNMDMLIKYCDLESLATYIRDKGEESQVIVNYVEKVSRGNKNIRGLISEL